MKTAFLSLFLATTTLAIATPPVASTINFKSTPFNTYWLRGETDEDFYMYVHLEGIEYQAEEGARVPYNLSLVIDKSGSMSGAKMDYTKQAVKYIINQLDEEDIISLVTYSDNVYVKALPIKVKHKKALLAKVDEITADGSTNLSGGVEKGFGQLRIGKTVSENKEYVHRVMLLSDGLANVGITSTTGLENLVKKYAEENLTLSTFGVGADYNEDLMAAMASEGGGKYYFIDSPEKLAGIFQEEMDGISNLVAKDVVLEIDYPEDQASFESVGLYSSTNSKGKVKIRLNDMFSKEQKAILVKFKIDPDAGGQLNFITGLTYQNPLNETEPSVEISKEHEVMVTDNKRDYNAGFDKDANMGYALMAGGNKFEAAQLAADKRNFKLAESELEEAKEIMEKHFSLFKPHPFLKEFYQEMQEYTKTLEKLQKTKSSHHFKLIQKKSKAYRFRTISCPSF